MSTEAGWRIGRESAIAALCDQPAELPDEALAELALTLRPAAVWVGWRLAHGTPRRHPTLVPVASALMAREAAASARLRAVVDVLGAAGIPSLVIKGAALAPWYPQPWMRPRRDDDLLVSRETFGAACRLLDAAGYQAVAQNPGPEDLGQAHFTRRFAAGDEHHLDLHWRALVPAAFAEVAPFGALLARSIVLPHVGPAVRGPSAVDALLHLVAHGVAHHGEGSDPQWVLDAHLLASSLSAVDWSVLSARAASAGVARILAHELRRAQRVLDTPVPAVCLERWAAAPPEPSAAHLEVRGRLHRWWIEARQQPAGSWQAFRVRAFPPADYMVRRYRIPRVLVPLAYGWRLGVGGGAWIVEAVRHRTA